MSSTQNLRAPRQLPLHQIPIPSPPDQSLYQNQHQLQHRDKLAIRLIIIIIIIIIISIETRATLQDMADTLSPAMAFGTSDFYNPQGTISLSDTSLQNSMMTPEPTSPESSYNVKDESVEGDESKKPTKKRKSWGQELPTPKTNLPPRYVITTPDSYSHLLTSVSASEQRLKMRKSNVALSVSFGIDKPLSHHESASDKKSRSSKAKSLSSSNRTSLSKND